MNNIRQHLESLKDRGILDRFAWAFARCLDRFAPGGQLPDDLFLLAALTAHHTLVDKHVCFTFARDHKLSDILEDLGPGDDFELPSWKIPSQNPFCSDAADKAYTPLIFSGGRLYLNRYFDYERSVAQALLSRTARAESREAGENPESLLVQDFKLDDSQRKAIAAAVSQSFTVITGGPGTGKTTLLCVILAALFRSRDESAPPFRVIACAPTGKAQARMKEAIDAEFATHIQTDVREGILRKLGLNEGSELPIDYGTIHRTLSYHPSSGKFRHNADNPLAADVVIVDEVSMADLPLFSHLIAAVPPEAKLILLGDSDQLSSVESGAVLSDICEAWKDKSFIAHLLHSHRFDEGSLIGKVKNLILEQKADAIFELLKTERSDSSVVWKTVAPAADLTPHLRQELDAHPEFRAYLDARDPGEALKAFDTFRILSATRRGYFGVERLNLQLQRLLKVETDGKGYPILITQNDPDAGLYNGDVGLCWPDENEGGKIRVFFPDGEGKTRAIPLARLPEHESVFAMTIHKSQGSGFDHVLLALPENAENKLLTKELLYTGLTRAKKDCVIWSAPDSLRSAITRATHRDSGLKEWLSASTDTSSNH